jgi:Winged helix DNA-binding domain
VADPALRKRIWTTLGGPGIVLVDGRVAGLWRPAKKGRKLLVTVEPLGRLGKGARDAIVAEADRLAPFRGAETAELAWGEDVRPHA